MNIKLSFGKTLSILISAILLSGCGGDVSQRELKAYINTLKERAAAKEQVQTQATVWQLPTPVLYQPHGYAAPTQQANTNVTNPLQAYPLSALRFVGTLTENNQVHAYIMTPDNMVNLVKEGDIIGEEYVRIIKIDERHIEIAKPAPAGSKSQQQVIVMELKDSND